MAKRWVAMRDGFADDWCTVPAGQVGFVVKEKSKQWGHTPREGHVVVHFPQTMKVFPESALDEVSPYEFKTALSILRDFNGHHCRDSQYQFNIKFYHWNYSPIAEKLLDENELDDARWTILSDNYNCNFKGECDYMVRDMFDWWRDEHQDGRSGGWLVVQHHSTDPSHFEDAVYDIQWRREQFEQELAETDIDDDTRYDLDDALGDLAVELRDVHLDANDLARDLEFIQEHINWLKEGLAEYMLTEECWEHLYDHKIEELEAEEQRKKDLAEGWEAWRAVRDYLQQSYFEEDSGMKVIDKINKIMPNY